MTYYEENKEKIREYLNRPEVRAHRREYQARPENRAKMKAYLKTYKISPKNRAKLKEYAKNHIKKFYEFINNYKSDKCCVECGYNKNPKILHFHHLRDKFMGIGEMSTRSINSVKLEMEKCILLCPNCHMNEHSKT